MTFVRSVTVMMPSSCLFSADGRDGHGDVLDGLFPLVGGDDDHVATAALILSRRRLVGGRRGFLRVNRHGNAERKQTDE